MIKQEGYRSNSYNALEERQRSNSQQAISKSNNTYTEIYVWGNDKYGQLGLGHKYTGKNYLVPKICSYNLVIKQISCGEEHTAFVTIRGHIYTIGSNLKGRLGIDNKQITQSSSPCLVEDLQKLVCCKIACGSNHTVAVMENGEAYSWGNGDLGVLGIGSQEHTWAPVKVLGQKQKYIDVSCGARHTMLLNQYGEVFACGSNEEGQLCLPNSSGELYPSKVRIEKAIEAVCGHYFTLILTQLGEIYSCGANNFGQLGIGHKTSTKELQKVQNLEDQTIIKVAAGHHSAALNRRGELFIWGTGVFGDYPFPTKFCKIDSPFNDISVGGFSGSSVDANGVVWTWGSNQNGELGVGDQEPRLNPFPVAALKGRKVIKVACGINYMVALSAPKSKDLQKQKHQSSAHHSSQGLGEDGKRKETLGLHVESTFIENPVSNQLQQQQPMKQSRVEERIQRQNLSLDYENNSRSPLNLSRYEKNIDKNEDKQYFTNSRNQIISPVPAQQHQQSHNSSQYNTINQSQMNNNHQRSHSDYAPIDNEKRSLSPISTTSKHIKSVNNNDQLRDIIKGEHSSITESYKVNDNFKSINENYKSINNDNYNDNNRSISDKYKSINDNYKQSNNDNYKQPLNDNYKSQQPNNQSYYASSQYSTINPSYSRMSKENENKNNSYINYNKHASSQANLSSLDNNVQSGPLKLSMPPISKSPSLSADTFNYESQKRVSTENYGSRKTPTYNHPNNFSNRQSKIPPLPGSQNNYNPEKQLHDIENNILQSKYNYLEETLRNERKEKLNLEQNLIELRRQLKEIQYGKGGLNDLSILLNEEMLKFDQLKKNHDELYKRNIENEQKIIELNSQLEYFNQIKESQDKNVQMAKEDVKEKVNQLQMFTSQIQKLEKMITEKQDIIDKLQINLETQNEKFKLEQKRTNEVVNQLNQQCQEFRDNYQFLEDRLTSYQENLKILEDVKFDLEKKNQINQQEIKEKDNQLIQEIQQKQKFEQFYYAELKQNEEINLENKSLREQLQSYKIKLQQSQDNEQRFMNQIQDLQEDNKQLKEEIPKIDELHREVRNKDEYIEELESKSNALKAQVKELEEKNIKLGELLNAEVDRQAEQYKQRTLKNLYHNAEQLYELFNQNNYNDENYNNNVSNINIKHNQEEEDFDNNHIIHNQTFDSVENPTDKKPLNKPSLNTSGYHQKPARVLQNNAQDSLAQSTNRNIALTPNESPKRFKQNISDNQSFTLNNKSDIVRSKLKSKIEEQKRKISSSAKKLLDILDNSHDNNSNIYNSNLANSQINQNNEIKQQDELLKQYYNQRRAHEEEIDQPLKRSAYGFNSNIQQQQQKLDQDKLNFSQNNNKQQQKQQENKNTPNQSNNVSLTYSPVRSKVKPNLDNSSMYLSNLQNQQIQEKNKLEKSRVEQDQKMKDLADVKERLAYMKRAKDQLESKLNEVDNKLNKYQDYNKK
ncbi:chromosome condensation regulator RCC1 repeat protein (macronuclear) [Tetrahymena thermophila SB210]|uniref:Chromosome condensation regulator RCC1 repeat protein n=1 Tax=Tetrahymena thermophila (strain SB210) TaxID=312017 RepID=I7MIU6_TETTS|nr:chromosome condensation regulator RCC1 repeat protein [Tetrahymena thermophila SB210]EAS04756.2 chromosome condensation regulator RCC1 repeat protein [Tetrahymena thermophila SB210]|eukprot:XP_001025001.2 chromosome condensation regulator RCC1 repeat protein [Tetrahymena thermophila SB210]